VGGIVGQAKHSLHLGVGETAKVSVGFGSPRTFVLVKKLPFHH